MTNRTGIMEKQDHYRRIEKAVSLMPVLDFEPRKTACRPKSSERPPSVRVFTYLIFKS